MTAVGMDLLPRDAELARRAAGGDGAAFVRLYDHYSTEVFTAALQAVGSIEAATDATQTAFLRILRWPPPLGAPDGDVSELLCALALGGGSEERASDSFDTEDAREVARLVGVGWLRSETVAKAGARFDDDWSVHLWAAPPPPEPEPERSTPRVRPRRARRLLDRLTVPLPSPAATAAVLVLLLFTGLAGTIVAGGETDPMEADPAAATGEPAAKADGQQQPLRTRRAERRAERRASEARVLRDKALQPLLAP
jgi:hypothetical protein